MPAIPESSTESVSVKSQEAENSHRQSRNLREDKPNDDSAGLTILAEEIDWSPENVKKILREPGGFSIGVFADLEEIRCSEDASRLSKRSLPLGAILKQHQQPPEALDVANVKLIMGATTDEADLVAQALEEGADINTLSDQGRTPLQIRLATSQRSSVLDLLLLYEETRVHLRDSKDGTLLHRAVRTGDLALLRRLISSVEDLQIVDADGTTPLHVAASDNGPCFASLQEISRIFAKQDVCADAIVNRDSRSALHVAAEKGLQESALELIRLGSDPAFIPRKETWRVIEGDKNMNTGSALYVAVKACHVELVRQMLDESQKIENLINLRHGPWGTLLECCMYNSLTLPKRVEMAEVLIERGADWRVLKGATEGLLALANSGTTPRLLLGLIAAGCFPDIASVDLTPSLPAILKHGDRELAAKALTSLKTLSIPAGLYEIIGYSKPNLYARLGLTNVTTFVYTVTLQHMLQQIVSLSENPFAKEGMASSLVPDAFALQRYINKHGEYTYFLDLFTTHAEQSTQETAAKRQLWVAFCEQEQSFKPIQLGGAARP